MRTTIDIPDEMYRELKSRAALEGATVKALLLQGVKAALASKKAPKVRKLKLPLIRAREPGTLHLTNKMIYDLIDLS